jgi:metal-responsive CopG/Arc/MetJ family transcriptional regulator
MKRGRRKPRTKAKSTVIQVEVPTEFLEAFANFWPGKYASRSDAIRKGMEKIMEPVAPMIPQSQIPAVGVQPQ